MVQVIMDLDFTNSGNTEILWNQAQDFLRERSFEELEKLNYFFDAWYPEITLTEVNHILSYAEEQDTLMQNAFGYIKDQNGIYRSPEKLTDLDTDILNNEELLVLLKNNDEILQNFKEDTITYLINYALQNDNIILTFEAWLKEVQDYSYTPDNVVEDLEHQILYFQFEQNFWYFDE